MTYAMMGLGASAQQGGCTGGVYGYNTDICCSVSDWNNKTYGAIKGAASRRYWDEKRVRHALALLLNQGGLADFAYKHGDLPIKSGFEAQLGIAANAYLKQYPASRWKQQEVGVFHKCGPGGHYSIWVDPTPPSGTDLGIISSVPMGADSANHAAMPDADLLLVVQNGQVAPGGWLQNFLGHFGKLKLPTLLGKRGTVTKPTRGSGVLQSGTASGQGMSTGAKVALGVGAAALVGAGLWWATKRR